jgi:hypothetical protein
LLQDAEGKSFGEPTAVVRIRVVPSNQQSAETKSIPESSNQLQVSRAGKADPGLIPGTRSRRETTASEVRWAKVQRFAAVHGVKPGSNLHSLVRALSLSPHSFKALRERGFTQSDSEFEKIIADHPGLFRSTRIIRRDENGKRIIPGWPAIALRL